MARHTLAVIRDGDYPLNELLLQFAKSLNTPSPHVPVYDSDGYILNSREVPSLVPEERRHFLLWPQFSLDGLDTAYFSQTPGTELREIDDLVASVIIMRKVRPPEHRTVIHSRQAPVEEALALYDIDFKSMPEALLRRELSVEETHQDLLTKGFLTEEFKLRPSYVTCSLSLPDKSYALNFKEFSGPFSGSYEEKAKTGER
jgi:hypothetical protein